MKYLIFQRRSNHFIHSLPVVFPEAINHSDVKVEGMTPVSGGFCAVDGMCWGKAVSVKLESRRSDAALLGALLTNDSSALNSLSLEDLPGPVVKDGLDGLAEIFDGSVRGPKVDSNATRDSKSRSRHR